MTHSLERTSPVGPGQKFIGRCIKCGQQDLPMSAALAACPEDNLKSDAEALVHLIEGTQFDD